MLAVALAAFIIAAVYRCRERKRIASEKAIGSSALEEPDWRQPEHKEAKKYAVAEGDMSASDADDRAASAPAEVAPEGRPSLAVEPSPPLAHSMESLPSPRSSATLMKMESVEVQSIEAFPPPESSVVESKPSPIPPKPRGKSLAPTPPASRQPPGDTPPKPRQFKRANAGGGGTRPDRRNLAWGGADHKAGAGALDDWDGMEEVKMGPADWWREKK